MDQLMPDQPDLPAGATPEAQAAREPVSEFGLEPLILINNKPFTAKGDVGVIMLVRTGVTSDPESGLKFQYFDYVTRFFAPPMRVAWDVDTMEAVLPPDTADYLIKNGYARVMTPFEVRAYNTVPGKEETETPSRKPKKGDLL